MRPQRAAAVELRDRPDGPAERAVEELRAGQHAVQVPRCGRRTVQELEALVPGVEAPPKPVLAK